MAGSSLIISTEKAELGLGMEKIGGCGLVPQPKQSNALSVFSTSSLLWTSSFSLPLDHPVWKLYARHAGPNGQERGGENSFNDARRRSMLKKEPGFSAGNF
ncbi:MAG: hypothetical protein KGH63_03340 [Candidatus Micrarchaeota archaeon]|nr:hypothetical protein [Candidatus Micrarchaeota archaeon]